MADKTLFSPGLIVATRGAINRRGHQDFSDLLDRHLSGDWGDLDDEDKAANDEAVRRGFRILSAYNTPEGKYWVITEADRSTTTILLPEEY